MTKFGEFLRRKTKTEKLIGVRPEQVIAGLQDAAVDEAGAPEDYGALTEGVLAALQEVRHEPADSDPSSPVEESILTEDTDEALIARVRKLLEGSRFNDYEKKDIRVLLDAFELFAAMRSGLSLEEEKEVKKE